MVSLNPVKRTPDQLYNNRLYGISRFLWMRQIYSQIQKVKQHFQNFLSPQVYDINSFSWFSGFDIETCLAEIRETAVSLNLQLPLEIVKEIFDYACQTSCTEPKYPHRFWIDQVHQGSLPDGHSVVRALVDEPSNCPAIKQLIHDPILLEIVHRYLQYRPNRITAHLTWSIASNLPETEIQKIYPPTYYHYDIAGYNFMTVYFYITAVQDEYSGPHIMIEKSHLHKPLALLFSGRHPDDLVYRYYSRQQERIILGNAGFGFIQDPSCIHKIKPPVNNHRLLLQLRYS
ncbi:hypothetical protein [Planktothrix tepida]|nr:hypothetical protein [Planktothrix tepida]